MAEPSPPVAPVRTDLLDASAPPEDLRYSQGFVATPSSLDTPTASAPAPVVALPTVEPLRGDSAYAVQQGERQGYGNFQQQQERTALSNEYADALGQGFKGTIQDFERTAVLNANADAPGPTRELSSRQPGREDNVAKAARTLPDNNYAKASHDLQLTPQEQNLYQHHMTNLAGQGKSVNQDGSISTIRNAIITEGGKFYNIPTVWDGKVLDVVQSIERAKQIGLNKFPSADSIDKLEARYNLMHDYMERDTAAYRGSQGQQAESSPSLQNPTELSGQPMQALPTSPTVGGQGQGYFYGATGVGAGHVAPKAERLAFMQQVAQERGLNPYALFLTAGGEGLHRYDGDNGTSFGDFQLHVGGGMGDGALRAGINIRDPNTWKQQIIYAADQMAANKNNPAWFAGQWHGAPGGAGGWAAQNYSNPNAPPPQGFSLAGGGGGSGRFGGRTGAGRGASPEQMENTFHGAVVNKDPNALLTLMQITPTPPGFEGNTARLMSSETMMMALAIAQGQPEKVSAIQDAFSRLSYLGVNEGLFNAARALQAGNLDAAAGYLSRAHSFFPDFTTGQYSKGSDGKLYVQRVGEASGQPIGKPMEVTLQGIMSQMQFTNDPEKFFKVLADQQKLNSETELNKANADYKRGLNDTTLTKQKIIERAGIRKQEIIEQTSEKRARIAQETALKINENKPPAGQVTDEQFNQNVMKDFNENYLPQLAKQKGFEQNTPEAAQYGMGVQQIVRNIANNGGRNLSSGEAAQLIQRLNAGQLVPAASNRPGKVTLVDKATKQPIQPPVLIDENIAAAYLGYQPQRQPGQALH